MTAASIRLDDFLKPAHDEGKEAVTHLLRKLGRHSRAGYPFGNPVSIEKKHVSVVTNPAFPYWVAEKTDGVRVALVCTRLNDKECCYLMDRLGRLFAFPIQADRRMFDGSLFDAELVIPHRASCTGREGDDDDEDDDDARGSNERATPPPFVILVFDVASIEGDADAGKEFLTNRLRTLHATFPNAFSDVATPTLRDAMANKGFVVSLHPDVVILAKHMRLVGSSKWLTPSAAPVDTDGSRRELEFAGPGTYSSPSVSGLDLPHDGYILTPDKQPACSYGMAPMVFKIKNTHTMDLLWDGALWYGDGEELYRMDTLGESRKFEIVAFPAHVPSESIVEVSPSPSADNTAILLTYVGIRTDRSTPNNAVCVRGSIASMDDAVTLDAILAAAHGAK